MTSHTGTQIITINILPDISKGKGNQTINFDLLIKYNVKSIFLQKIMQKMRQGD